MWFGKMSVLLDKSKALICAFVIDILKSFNLCAVFHKYVIITTDSIKKGFEYKHGMVKKELEGHWRMSADCGAVLLSGKVISHYRRSGNCNCCRYDYYAFYKE